MHLYIELMDERTSSSIDSKAYANGLPIRLIWHETSYSNLFPFLWNKHNEGGLLRF